MPFPLLAAAAPIMGAVVGAASDYLGSGRQMRFQERMSSTAYQRAVEDMRRAGLNPSLAYSQGGASSPQGADWSPGRTLSEGISSAARVNAEVRLLKAQKEATEKQGAAAESQATTAAGRLEYDKGIFNRETPFLALDRAYQLKLREQELQQSATASRVALLDESGAKADLTQREVSGEMYKSLQSSLGKTFGKGWARDIANIVLMVLQSQGASSAFRTLVSPGRR